MSKTERVIEKIEQMIDKGVIAPGGRLPSVRQGAVDFGVSKNTIVEAYARLDARRVIRSKRGSGYFVNETSQTSRTHANSVLDAFDAVSLLNAQLSQDYEVRPGDGRPPRNWMQDALPKKIESGLVTLVDEDHSGYGNPLGYGPLRKLISRRFSFAGPTVSPEQVVTTFGANHALDLLIRRYLSPGQTVLVDDPGYYPLFAKLHLAQVRIVAIRRDRSGPDIQHLENAAATHSPAMFFTQSTAQNPTGSSYDLRTSHAVLRISAKYGFRVVDDDPFLDLPGLNGKGNRLWELDGFHSMIFVGSYSKLLSASFRSGFIVSDDRTVAEIGELKMITTVNSSRLSEVMIARMIENGRYDKHLKRLDRRLAVARELCTSRLKKMELEIFTECPEGFYTMLKLPTETDIDLLRERAQQQSVFLALGQYFSPNSKADTKSMRVNFTRATDPRFFSFLENTLFDKK